MAARDLEQKGKKMAEAYFDEVMVDMILAAAPASKCVNRKSFEYKTVSTFIDAEEKQGIIKCRSSKEQQSMEKLVERIIQLCYSVEDMLVYQKTDMEGELFGLIICKPGSNAWNDYFSRSKVKKMWSEVKEAYNG